METTSTQTRATVQRSQRAGAAVRVAFGVIWALDAQFKWRPGFRHGFVTLVKQAGEGQPGWLHPWFHFWLETVRADPGPWAYAIAALETAIAAALILGFARKLTYLVTAITGLMIWAVAEGFGGPYTATSTDIGTGIVYALVALALLALNLEAGPSPYSLDRLLERRLRWWWRVSELSRRQTPSPTTERAPSAPAR